MPENTTHFILDVNSYLQDKNKSIINLAKSLAQQAVSEKRAVVMRPMSAYERRIVHMELAHNDKITTESMGEGEDRRVVIRPVDLL
jgi:spoIIIJ-associated protein